MCRITQVSLWPYRKQSKQVHGLRCCLRGAIMILVIPSVLQHTCTAALNRWKRMSKVTLAAVKPAKACRHATSTCFDHSC